MKFGLLLAFVLIGFCQNSSAIECYQCSYFTIDGSSTGEETSDVECLVKNTLQYL